MTIKVEKKKFIDSFGFIKKTCKGIVKDRFILFKFISFCFIFVFLSIILKNVGANFDISNLKSLNPEMGINSIESDQVKNIVVNILNSFLSFFVLGIVSLSFLFFKVNPRSFKYNLLHFFNYKFYFNFISTVIFLLIFLFLCAIIFFPSSLLNIDFSKNIDGIYIEKLLLSLTNFELILSFIGFFVMFASIPFFLLSTFINYMNVMQYNSGVISTYFKTLGGLFKRFTYWAIPLFVYFVLINTLIEFLFFNNIDLTYQQIIFNALLKSLYLGFGGYILFQLQQELYPADNFNPDIEEKDKIIKKFNKYKDS